MYIILINQRRLIAENDSIRAKNLILESEAINVQVGNRGQTLGSLGGRGVSHGVPQVGSNWGLGAASDQSTEALERTLSVSESVQDYSEGLPWRYRGRGGGVGTGIMTGVGKGVGAGVKAGSGPVNGAALLSPSFNTVVGIHAEEQHNQLYREGVDDSYTWTDLVGQGDSVLDMDRCSAAPLKLLSKFKRILLEKEAFRQVKARTCDLLLAYGYKYCMS